MKKINKIFGVQKPVIGMLHLDYLLGQEGYSGIEKVIEQAEEDLIKLEEGGIDGLLIENWREESLGAFVESKTATSMAVSAYQLSKKINCPFGINVLNNDYQVAYDIAVLTGADFIQLDVFVDQVVSDFKYNQLAKENPFQVEVDPVEVFAYAQKVGGEDIPLFAFIQPKHYQLINEDKTIEESAQQAKAAGATAVLVTKATGEAPTLELIKKAKSLVDIPVGIGSGLNMENVKEFMEVADFAVVGTALKKDGQTNNSVDLQRVKNLMLKVKEVRED